MVSSPAAYMILSSMTSLHQQFTNIFDGLEEAKGNLAFEAGDFTKTFTAMPSITDAKHTLDLLMVGLALVTGSSFNTCKCQRVSRNCQVADIPRVQKTAAFQRPWRIRCQRKGQHARSHHVLYRVGPRFNHGQRRFRQSHRDGQVLQQHRRDLERISGRYEPRRLLSAVSISNGALGCHQRRPDLHAGVDHGYH